MSVRRRRSRPQGKSNGHPDADVSDKRIVLENRIEGSKVAEYTPYRTIKRKEVRKPKGKERRVMTIARFTCNNDGCQQD